MAKKFFIIDGHAHIYAAYYAPMRQQLTSPSGEPTKATYIFTTIILGLIESQKPDLLVVAMDSKTPTFRTKIYPEYKAHRPPMPDDMPVQIGRIEQVLAAMRIPMIRVDGFEADDVIGTLAKKTEKVGYEVYICSKDKDMLQLLDKHIFAYDIKNNITTTPQSMAEELGVRPEQFIDVLALQGDASDNVPGVEDVGPKTALEWIKEYGSIENLYKHADDIKGKRGDNLRKAKELVSLSRKLVTIDCDVPIKLDFETFSLKEPDKTKIADVFTELGFNRLLTQLGLTVSAEEEKSKEFATEEKHDFSKPANAKTLKHNYQLIDTAEKFKDFYIALKTQKIFAIDTETTSINPMMAELAGISFSWKAGGGFYLPIKVPLGTKHLDIKMVQEYLSPILIDEKIRKIGQNIKYDMLVLRNAGLPLKGVYFDTMVASYCLDAERMSHSMDAMALDYLNYECIPISALIGKGKNQLTFDMVDTTLACEYSAEDADITFQLYEYLKVQLDKEPAIKKLFEEIEMPLVPVLAEMEYNGVTLDVKLLKKMSGDIAGKLKEVTDKIYELAGMPFNPDSPKQLAEVLFDMLGLESSQIGKSGRSTSADVLEDLAGAHPIIDLISEYRQLSKLQNTYVDKLGLLINPKTGRVHASFNQTVTATGRLSSSDPNLQNIPVKTELGRKIRSAFVPAKKTDCILSADYSQIELRLLAYFSKDKALQEAFENDQDIHSFVASQIYGVPIEKVTSQMRSSCKAVNFGIIYGQGAFGLSRTAKIGMAEAKKFIDDYFNRYKSIRKFMDDAVEKAAKVGYAETIMHRRRKIVNLKTKNFNKRTQAERLVVNTLIQGSAADLIKVAMINIQKKIEAENLPVKMILQIHDELVFELPLNQAEKHAQWIKDAMTEAIKLDVPLKVDVTIGSSWFGDK